MGEFRKVEVEVPIKDEKVETSYCEICNELMQLFRRSQQLSRYDALRDLDRIISRTISVIALSDHTETVRTVDSTEMEVSKEFINSVEHIHCD